ncbi:c-type cytochrome [Rhodoligotrophos defluvii]|uniref:c-type cytochrome n=1 Tax=Rhodoligotrophos defluvii TaxID=2561934 RepID=UPI0010C98B41|nr:c-type cytochrome [Rhodoligotrophos defluvii]
MADQPDRVYRLTRWQRLGIAAAILLGLALVGGSLFIWSGFYNVAASRDHFAITTWVLEVVRDQSIKARAEDIEAPPDLADPNLIKLGAAHYAGACAFCHGTPGQPRNPIVANMLPAPPDLSTSYEYDPKELYWIILHGLKYTGMPAWPGRGRGDEVWPLVALVEYLKETRPDFPEELLGIRPEPGVSGAQLAEGSDPGLLTNCVRCHGDESHGPISTLIPLLHGQSPAYLARALEEYRSSRRESGIMEPVAFALEPDDIEPLVEYYATMAPPPSPTPQQPPDSAAIARGALIAARGLPQSQVPACLSCHGANRNGTFPSLDGQPAAYLVSQLQLWKSGGRDETGYGAIMSVVANRLTTEQIQDIAAYFQSRTPSPEDRPSVQPSGASP